MYDRSQLGRADPVLVDKAARLVGRHARAVLVRAAGPGHVRAAARHRTHWPGLRRKRPTRDSIICLVLANHAEADRPLGFDQVVELSGNRVTRAQVRAAGSALCRDGQLDRLRSAVYQWSAVPWPVARRSTEFPSIPAFLT